MIRLLLIMVFIGVAVVWVWFDEDVNRQDPVPLAAGTPVPAPDQGYAGVAPLDEALVAEAVRRITNEERQAHGLERLSYSPVITEVAQGHSESMIRFGYGHVVQGKDATDRALAAGYDCRSDPRADGSRSYGLAENIARSPRVTRYGERRGPLEYFEDEVTMARAMVTGWMNSPGHRANILNPEHRIIGVGVAIQKTPRNGWTQETMYGTQNFSPCPVTVPDINIRLNLG